MLALLGAVLVFGEERNGCKCWLGGGSLQPSEAAKVMLIIALAAFWSLKEERQGTWLGLIGSLLVLGVPLFLVLKQPDMGTSMVIIGAWGVMAWTAGLRWSQLGLVSVAGVIAAVKKWESLQGFQKDRLLTFINPELDPMGAGYQVLMSQNAIGAGGLVGQGLNRGLASQRNFLPVQSSDFVFSVVGEELGFVGATALLCLLMLVVFQAWRIAEQARDPFGRLLASGIGGVLLVHILENVGMTMGVMPMTGIPLPFISVGGTFIIVVLACMGILQSIALRHRPLVF
jgi:rod shape determining protein RodA